MTDILNQIRADEGYRRFPYVCTAGALTIGYGRNIDKDHGGEGVTESESTVMLVNNLRSVEQDMERIFPGHWANIDQVRKNALMNMRYQLGAGGFRGFRRMIHAVEMRRWDWAAREAINSKWAMQTPTRAFRVADELRDGISL